MLKHSLVTSILAVTLSVAGAGASAHEGKGPMAHQPGMMQSQQGDVMMKGQHMMGQNMMGQGRMGRRGMGPDMMMGSHMMGPNHALMMMAMMDSNSDGALSLEEIQAVHARLFQYADKNGDGKLTLDEMRNFMHGGFKDDE